MIRFLILVSILSPGLVQAAKVPCKIKMPLYQKGCQGDWCVAGVSYLIADHDIDLVKDLQTKTVMQKIPKGTKMNKPFSFEMVIKRAGLRRVIEKTFELEDQRYSLKRGTVFEVLYDAGQGNYAICVENDIVKLELKNNAEELAPIKGEEWIKVKLDPKTSGFVKYSEVKIINDE